MEENNLKEAVVLLIEEVFKEKEKKQEEQAALLNEFKGIREELSSINNSIKTIGTKSTEDIKEVVEKEPEPEKEMITHSNLKEYYESMLCPVCKNNIKQASMVHKKNMLYVEKYTCKCGFMSITLNKEVPEAKEKLVNEQKVTNNTSFKKGEKRKIASLKETPFEEWKKTQKEMLLLTVFENFNPVYEYLRKNYGIVWEQIKKENGIKSNKGLFKIVYNDEKLRSLFQSSLSNMTSKKETRFNVDECVARLTNHDRNTSGNKTIIYNMERRHTIDWDNELKKLSKNYPDVENTKIEAIKHDNKLKCLYISTVDRLVSK